HPLRLADLHAVHGIVEPLDHRALAQREGERIQPARAVELLSVAQRARVVHPDRVPALCPRHVCPPEVRAAKSWLLPRVECATYGSRVRHWVTSRHPRPL